MCLDEAGSHSLEIIERDFPVFVLGGVIIDRAYLFDVVENRMRELKLRFFGQDDFILHTADIVRARGPFESLRDIGRRDAFLDALTELMQELDYVVVACAIRKQEFLLESQALVNDLYPSSLEILVDQFCRELEHVTESGFIYAERRRPDLDIQLELAWERLRRTGSQRLDATRVSKQILELVLKDKHVQNAGLQLADLVVSPIGRAIAGYPKRADWDTVESKLRQEDGEYINVGLRVLPE